MISDPIWLAPTWVRWLVNSATFLVFLVPFVVCTFPTFLHRVGWLWVLVAAVVVSVIEGAAVVWAWTPTRRRQFDVLDGFSNEQRAQSLAALRTGEPPTDHAVLGAAVRLGDLWRAYRRGTPRRLLLLSRWMPLVVAVFAIAEYFQRAPRVAELFIVVAAVLAARSATLRRRARRIDKNLETLRAAADSSALTTQPADNGAVLVAMPKRRALAFVAAVVIPYLVLVSVVLWVDRSRPDCPTVHAAATFIYDSRQLEETPSFAPGSVNVAAYQAWSDRLQEFGRQVSNPAVAPRLWHIADLSTQVVTQVGAINSASEDGSRSAKTAFYRAVRQVVDEDNALMAYCF